MKPLEVIWRNFRGMTRPTSVTFPLLTVLIGRNNVGKTSTYAPLLALRQTLDARSRSTALLSRGSLLDIGNYSDFVSGHDTTKDVVFQISIPDVEDSLISTSRRELRAGSVSITFGGSDRGESWLKSHTLYDTQGNALTSRARRSPDEHFEFRSRLLPRNVSVGRPLREVAQLKAVLKEEAPEAFMFTGFAGLRIPLDWREDEKRWSKVRPWFNAVSHLYEVQVDAKYRLERELRGISYIGPLRSLPQRTYKLTPERPDYVGRDGRYAPEILYRCFVAGEGLVADVEQWLAKLGYGQLQFEAASDEYFQLNLEARDGNRVNIAHSGIGVSQLLPILVEGLTARSGSTLIAQQPEIHLNPAQQTVLADFLIDVTTRERRVIIETHSEHVLLRVRRRIAEGQLSAHDVAVYFVDSDGTSTSVQRVEVGELGEISEWPPGFFEEQITDAFAMAAAQARRGERSD